MAHGALRQLLTERGLEHAVEIDSCGTGGHHAGEAPNEMMQSVALRRGYKLSDLRSRQLCASDYRGFDLIVAMDRANERDILERKPRDATCRVVRFMDYVAGMARRRPGPRAGRIEGFEQVCDLIEAGVGPLLEDVLTS